MDAQCSGRSSRLQQAIKRRTWKPARLSGTTSDRESPLPKGETTNVRPAKSRFEAVNDAVAFDDAQVATKHEIRTNELRLKRAEERRKRGKT